MASTFGKTWWGEHWLRSLDHIDHYNRLPRGAVYARKGHVLRVDIQGNTIRAEVEGSRPKPYRVTIIVPPFFEDQTDRLIDRLIAQPALISKLLNRELDPSILDIAGELGLKVFPSQWSDFKMQCSCPDWAVPCKHLAAVIYMISREIDNNPFLVFGLHSVDLKAELDKRGIQLNGHLKAEILKLKDLLSPNGEDPVTYRKDSGDGGIDFSILEDISGPIVQVLPDAPPFYAKGNFREEYRTQMRRIEKDARRLIKRKMMAKFLFWSNVNTGKLSHYSDPVIRINSYQRHRVEVKDFSGRTMGALILALMDIPPEYLPDYQPSVGVLHTTMMTALHLVANGAVVPQLVQRDDRLFSIRWLPALIDGRTRMVVDKLRAMHVPGILMTPHMEGDDYRWVPARDEAVNLLSLFLTEYIEALSGRIPDDAIDRLFFRQLSVAFDGVGEQALSGGIKVWLDRYFLAAETIRPVIRVEERTDDTFEVIVAIEDVSDPGKPPIELAILFQDPAYGNQRFAILQGISLLSALIPGLDQCINTGGAEPILLDKQAFAPFLMEVMPAIRLLDIRVLLPKSLEHLWRPQPTVRLSRKNEEGGGYIRMDQLLDFDWQVALGDEVLSEEDFRNLLQDAAGLIRFRDHFVYVSEEDLKRLRRVLTGNRRLSGYEMLQTALSGRFEGAPVTLGPGVAELIRELSSQESIPLPGGLNATLRPYQERGYSWLYKNGRIGFGSILADDMGLGKTLQVITLLLKYREEGALGAEQPALVVVPSGLLANWQAEIARFAPGLTTFIYHGSSRELDHFAADVMLTTYGIVRSDHPELKKKHWQVVIIDEAQNIKNDAAAQSGAVKGLNAAVKLALSGTPVENRLSEFWSIMDFVNRGYLGSAKLFDELYGRPIQLDRDEKVAERFRKVTAPFLMRRMKTDKSIINDLPDKIEQNQYSVLTPVQAALYQKTMLTAMEQIEEITGTGPQNLFKRQAMVLQMILSLKQICNHPTQFLKNGKVDASLSGKMELLFDLLDTILERREKVLVFSQFREMGDLLQRFVTDRYGEKPLFYHGGCTLTQRKEMVDRFQENRADRIFILSLKAAGTGLNLTAAQHVIHYDLWWNPAVETQATDRAYRIGQTKNVMVHRMITRNTFEERIDQMIQGKRHLAELTVSTGENWIGRLSNKELRDLFR